jgi:hypothetical protein
MQANSIYPSIVSKPYLQYQRQEDFALPIGHDAYIVLFKELRGLAGNVTADDLAALRLTAEQAYSIALENLERLFKEGAIKAQKISDGPGGKPFIVVAGHWDAAAVVLLPRFSEFVAKNLGQTDICLSIPRQGIALAFTNGDENYRNLIRTFVRQNEGHERKLITFGLFTVEGNSLKTIEDPETL